MRFLANGVSLPDELLVARDEGRVLFFCGAGVSCARAKLPGFFGLAERVLNDLRALPDSPARKLVETAIALHKEPIAGVSSILAADRVFGLLEREFAISDIERAVGNALRPKADPDLSAHKILLDLSRNPNADFQLVTTNFDLLFEAAAPRIPRWTPNRLPDLQRHHRFHGVVHLHGMFDEDYSKPDDGRFVLSSAEFGRAYLAEGWATQFIRDAIKRYVLVFVGYSADDPPVQYLLEALNRSGDRINGLYAFQEGKESEAIALWSHKGVTPLAYPAGNGHSALWQTLAAWSVRARNPEQWRTRLLRQAQRGPETMLPHERGQVVHLAMTEDGARSIADAERPIPASWLCIFDPTIRYGTPGKAALFNQNSPDVEPFLQYGLDSDPEPEKQKPSELHKKRETPISAINVLAATKEDAHSARPGVFCGDANEYSAQLSSRMLAIGWWLSRVSGLPAAIWWAAGQKKVHPVVRRNIEWALDYKHISIGPTERMAWNYVIDGWRNSVPRDSAHAYSLLEKIKKDGWNPFTRRDFAKLMLPRLTVERPYGAAPPTKKKGLRVSDLLRLDVQYLGGILPIEIPDSELAAVIAMERAALEEAVRLEGEIGAIAFLNIPPIEPDASISGSSRDYDLGSYVLRFAALFRRLAKNDNDAARSEFLAWRKDDPIFGRLRFWAAGIPGFLTPAEAGSILAKSPDRTFWGFYDQRDVLLVLGSRWRELPQESLCAIEKRLRRGPCRRRGEKSDDYKRRRAVSVLERLAWLKKQECILSPKLHAEIEKLKKDIPSWNDSNADRAVSSMESHAGFVQTDKSFDSLADVPIAELVSAALNSSRRSFLVENDPFAGLCEMRPLRVVAALRRVDENKDDARIGWIHFLRSGARINDKPKLTALIARRIACASDVLLRAIMPSLTSWFEFSAKRIFAADAPAGRALFDKLLPLAATELSTSDLKFAKIDEERDWSMTAWSSPAARLVAALLADPLVSKIDLHAGFPQEWIERATALRKLPHGQGRLALFAFARHLSWLYACDPGWTENMMIAAFDQPGPDHDAALAGFLFNARIEGEALFLRLKPALIAWMIAGNERKHSATIGGLWISAWRLKSDSGERWLSDGEFRSLLINGSDEMRGHVLWQVRQWPDIEEKLIFLKTVWPLQLAARSSSASARLCEIAFGDEANFPVLVETILPLIGPSRSERLMLPMHSSEEKKILKKYPFDVLKLLSAMLPMDVAHWPYGVESVLSKMREVAPSVTRDQRYLDLLKRKAR